MYRPTCIFWANLTPFSLQASQQSWERRSEERADVANSRKDIWQHVWNSCTSVAKSCTDSTVMRQALLLLEAIMLTDRVSSAVAVETDSFFAWDAAVIRERHVPPVVWRFLFVRLTKYALGSDKHDQIRKFCAQLATVAENIHADGDAAAYVALLSSLFANASVPRGALVRRLGSRMPVLADLAEDDRRGESELLALTGARCSQPT
jgi:hypothetical protein